MLPNCSVRLRMDHNKNLGIFTLDWTGVVCVYVFKIHLFMGFPSSSLVKNLPMQEMQIWSLGQEDPLEKEMATHSSIFARRTPKTEEPGGLQSMGL